jgi:hypothetical protein
MIEDTPGASRPTLSLGACGVKVTFRKGVLSAPFDFATQPDEQLRALCEGLLMGTQSSLFRDF